VGTLIVMQNDNKKTKESVPTKSAPARAAVESRSVERLDAFVARIGAPSSPLQVDRRGRRKTIADVDVPQKQTNGNALRFGLRAFDVVAVTAIIMVAVWNAYVGQNDRGMLAPIAAGLLGAVMYSRIKVLHRRGALTPNIVMLGATESARRLIETNAKTHDLNILAIFDDRISRAPLNIHGVPIIGKIEDMLNWDQLPYINRIVVTLPSMAAERKQKFIEQVRLVPNSIAFLVDEFENLNHVQQRLSEIANVSLRDVTGKAKSGRHTAIKRLTDIVLSFVALTFGAPILLLIALLIKRDSKGPVLFKQERHGFNNRVFEVYKFRSMRVDMEDKLAERQVSVGDDRVTKLGNFIRKTSIDELPQLINVLKGEMSLVGPRPHAVGMRTEGKDSIDLVAEYAHRHRVKPGMTGWAQINGSRGALLNQADVARRVQLDIEYIERSSFFFDLMIMLKTLPCLLGDSETIR